MKKLYIPTSTLNFNNIFASESISPACFYTQRNFGYTTFEKIKLNNFDKTILLYDKLPLFDIGDTERDNYPMIIEIDMLDVSLQPIKRYQKISIFQWTETIYLNPFSTKVFFLLEETKKITLLGAERSASTKMVGLYEKFDSFQIRNDSVPSFQFKDDFLNDVIDVNVSSEELGKNIDIDQQKNRAKGFMYSFLLGDNKSLNKELVTIKKCAREIGNIVSAISHSPDKSITNAQRESLDKIGNEFSDAYNSLDNNKKILNDKLTEIVSKANITIDSAKELIKSLLGCSWEQAENYVCGQYEIRKPLNVKTLLQSEYENAVSKINEIVVQKETEYLRNKQKLNILKRIALANFKLTSLSEEKADFYTTLINEFISIDYQKENRIDIAVRGITLLKEMLKSTNCNWENSQDRTYYNELLANLQGKDSFDALKIDNVIRQSFALFVQYKDDIEKIETALISNLISEYRFAFGLWGTVVGFAGMPKTLTNDLFLSDDLDYISEVYKYIYNQVHGKELEGKLEVKQSAKKEESITIPSIMNEPKTKQPLSQTPPKVQQDNSDDSDIINQLAVCKLKPEQIESIREIYKNNHFLINDKFFASIKKIKGIGDKALEKIKNAFGVELPKIKMTENNSLFGEMRPETGSEFYKDTNALAYLEKLLPNDKKIKSQFKTDIEWFQNNHNKSYDDKSKGTQLGVYFGKPTDNQSVIERFEKYLENKKTSTNPKTDWLRRIYSQIDILAIISKLKELYLQHE